jgi:lipid A ethanolaminephosphotransferase
MTASGVRPPLGTGAFIALAALANALLYHLPLFRFAAGALDLGTLGGWVTLATLLMALLSATGIALGLLAQLGRRPLKAACVALAIGNAVALYFVLAYGVVLDRTLLGNVGDTNLAEALELLHPALLACVLALGAAPALLVARTRIAPVARWRLAAGIAATFVVTLAWAYLAAGSWLWFDHNAKKLGGLVLPWSYVVNGARAATPRLWPPGAPIALPPGRFISDEPTLVVLVIGEAARRRNFALYGYGRPTTPLLAKAGVVALPGATACSTYTTASVRCILSHADAASEFAARHEPLPAYLQRHGVEVIWRTRNWGQPPMQLATFERARDLRGSCAGAGCDHDEVLLTGLEERLRASPARKTLLVLHEMGSHGPAYSARYPAAFETFTPACKSVQLSQCTAEELVNAYDNTIRYNDYVLSRVIALLQRLAPRPSLLIYVSDHGESLGEHGLYLHGTPATIAPDVQTEIPFLLWLSPEFRRRHRVDAQRLLAPAPHSQREVFHTVLGALGLDSPVYEARYDVLGRP